MDEQISLRDISPEYEAFIAKFKSKKTTDDCYTPPGVYEAVKKWACEKYNIDPDSIVRPFYPGGDYERFSYPDGCTVLDNPPFSILSKICLFYVYKNIRCFLFAPGLTCFDGLIEKKMGVVVCDAQITYENGARVPTAFVTNLAGDIAVQSAPDLHEAICMANKAALDAKNQIKTASKYEYPHHVLTAAMLQRYAKYGVEFAVRWSECEHVRTLDVQKKFGKKIFGSGLLLSDQASAKKATAEKATAEKATAEKVTIWNLSAREREIVRRLSLGSDPGTHSGIDPQENEIDRDYLLQEERFAEYTAQHNLFHMMEDGK